MSWRPFLWLLIAAVLLSSTTFASAASERHGSIAGDPRVFDDGAACLDAVDFEPVNLAPGAPTCSVLYGHLFNVLSAVPINTQRPPDGQSDLARGITGEPVIEGVGFNKNQLTLYSSPGVVEYQSADDDDPRMHPPRGLSSDVHLSRNVPIVGYWYMSADAEEVSTFGGDHIDGVDVGAMPCLTVRMVLETNRVHGIGTVVAQGQTTKTVVSGPSQSEPDPTGLRVDCGPLGATETELMLPEEVTEFRVELGVADRDIPMNEGYHVFVEWYQWAPGDPDDHDKVAQRQWNVHTGPSALNRILIPLDNAVEVLGVRPIPHEGQVYLSTAAQTPWGSYDVDPGSLRLRILDEGGTEVATRHVAPPELRYSIHHDGLFQPVNATFAWDVRAEALPPGMYTMEVWATNWQHTALAVQTAGFRVADNGLDHTFWDSHGLVQDGDGTLEGGRVAHTPGAWLGAILAVAVVLAGRRRA